MKILIADDESIIRMGLKSMLLELGHTVFAARDGREALEHARAYQPDLAILDIRMPRTDGLDVARILGRTQPMPIILLTAYGQQDLVEQASDLSINAYLIKPVDATQLSAAITLAVRQFDERRTLLEQRARLAHSLEIRKLLDRAKGKLMAQGMSEREAYLYLQRRARESRRTLQEIATEIVTNHPPEG